MSQTVYDVFPYAEDTHPQTHISHLFTIGRLFGLSPPDFRKSRVLELGCASGSNPLGRFILSAVDGTRDHGALIELVMTAIANGQFKIEQQGSAVTDVTTIERNAAAAVDHFLTAFRVNALLSACRRVRADEVFVVRGRYV